MRCRPAAWRASSDPVRLRPQATDQQPLLRCWLAPPGVVMCRANPPSGEPRGQWRVAAVAPLDLSPGIGGEFQSQGLGGDRLMRLVAAQPHAGPAAARSGRRRQRCLAGPPDHRGRQDAGHVGQPKFADPSTQFTVVAIGRVHQCHGRRHAIRHRLTQLLQCDLGLGLEADVIRHAGDRPAPDRRPKPSADTAGRRRAGCRDGSPPIGSPLTWQLSCLPNWPQYCRATPTEWLPFLRKAGVIDDPGLDRLFAGDRRQHPLAHAASAPPDRTTAPGPQGGAAIGVAPPFAPAQSLPPMVRRSCDLRPKAARYSSPRTV